MSEEKEVDENIELAHKMMKAAGKVTARQLSEAALICIQLAALTSDPDGYFEHISLGGNS